MKHINFKKEYEILEKSVFDFLIEQIQNSNIQSKHIEGSCINVSVFDYVELIIVGGKLTWVDNDANTYSIYSDCDLSDLIDVISSFDNFVAIKMDASDSVLVRCGNLELWLDVYKTKDDIVAEWNKYIFDLSNSKDTYINKFQSNCDNYDQASSVAIQYYKRRKAYEKSIQ